MLSSRPFDPAPTLSDSTPAPLGSAAAGVGTTVSRTDHVHAMPTAADVGAPALSSTPPAALGVAAIGVGTTAARADHVHVMPSAADVGAAATSHAHAATDITGGTLAVARGGTGSGTAAAARDALGVQDSPRIVPFFEYATADDGTPVVQGYAGFTPADYAITARTTVLTLDAIGSVTSGAQTGTLEVLNAAGTVVASIDWTETTPTRKTDVITLPGSAEIYRARVSCAGVVDPLTDYALIGGAVLRITWS